MQFSSVSEQWAQYSVAGPRSRDVLRKVVDRQHDISNAAFPYMAAAELTVMRRPAGAPVPHLLLRRTGLRDRRARRIRRCADGGKSWTAGREFGIAPYGTEALGVMRVEKGHVAGNEMNGQTTARDLGLAKMLSTRKDYVGRVMAQRPGLLAADRPTLGGLQAGEPR